jgi:hypothetical protein
MLKYAAVLAKTSSHTARQNKQREEAKAFILY